MESGDDVLRVPLTLWSGLLLLLEVMKRHVKALAEDGIANVVDLREMPWRLLVF